MRGDDAFYGHPRATSAIGSSLHAGKRGGAPSPVQRAGGLAHGQVAGGRQAAGLDRVTLYRALGALTEAGLVHRVQGVDGVWYYHAHTAIAERCPAGHPHFQCVRCGRVRCLVMVQRETDSPLDLLHSSR